MELKLNLTKIELTMLRDLFLDLNDFQIKEKIKGPKREFVKKLMVQIFPSWENGLEW